LGQAQPCLPIPLYVAERDPALAGAADVARLAPFADERVRVGAPHLPEVAPLPAGVAPAAKIGAVLADDLVGRNEAVVIQAKPLAALWAMDGAQPIPEAANQVCQERKHGYYLEQRKHGPYAPPAKDKGALARRKKRGKQIEAGARLAGRKPPVGFPRDLSAAAKRRRASFTLLSNETE